MSKDFNFVLAGFGGQGLLFGGKVIATAGLIEDKELSWMPSYGPEMRGGTANCSVCLSDDPIGSPLVSEPNGVIVMNQPSFDKFADTVEPGGVMVVDTTMVPNMRPVEGVKVVEIPATAMAEEHGLKGLANIICVGKLWAETRFCGEETIFAAIERCVPARKQHLLEPNKNAIKLGIEA